MPWWGSLEVKYFFVFIRKVVYILPFCFVDFVSSVIFIPCSSLAAQVTLGRRVFSRNSTKEINFPYKPPQKSVAAASKQCLLFGILFGFLILPSIFRYYLTNKSHHLSAFFWPGLSPLKFGRRRASRGKYLGKAHDK